MKTILAIFLAVICISSISFATDKRAAPDAVVVKVLDKPLPSKEDERGKFLWDCLASKPDEQKFDSYTTQNWKRNFEDFAAALVKKADSQKLDSVSLRKVLDLVLKDSKDKLAYLPVGAYQTTLDGKLVWIVPVMWEFHSVVGADGQRLELGLSHIRVFAFEQRTLQDVGFVTCG